MPPSTSRVNSSPGAFLKRSLTIFIGNTASPGSSTVTPAARQITEVFISVAWSITDSADAFINIDESMLTVPPAEVLLSARLQLPRNCFLFTASFIG